MLKDYFKLKENGTSVRIEALAGLTTFATMAYIIFVQPVVLGAAGMNAGAVFTSTCLITAFATVLMAFLANYPVAVAPAMGHNFFFAYVVVLTMKIPWQVALGAVFLSGIVFVATASFGLREMIVASVPDSLKSAIAVGIGLLITLIGMEWAGIVRLDPNTFVTLGNLSSKPVLIALLGLGTTIILIARRVNGAILIGILVGALAGLFTGIVKNPGSVLSVPPSVLTYSFSIRCVDCLKAKSHRGYLDILLFGFV